MQSCKIDVNLLACVWDGHTVFNTSALNWNFGGKLSLTYMLENENQLSSFPKAFNTKYFPCVCFVTKARGSDFQVEPGL